MRKPRSAASLGKLGAVCFSKSFLKRDFPCGEIASKCRQANISTDPGQAAHTASHLCQDLLAPFRPATSESTTTTLGPSQSAWGISPLRSSGCRSQSSIFDFLPYDQLYFSSGLASVTIGSLKQPKLRFSSHLLPNRDNIKARGCVCVTGKVSVNGKKPCRQGSGKVRRNNHHQDTIGCFFRVINWRLADYGRTKFSGGAHLINSD